MIVLGLCYIGRSVRGNGFVLIRFASGEDEPLAFFAMEPPVAISDETMRSEGIEVVLGNLRVPPGPGLRPLSFLNADDKQRMLKLKREHELISVTLLRKAKEELEIAPLHAKQGWRFDVRPEEFLRVKLPLANSEFLKVLDQAFDTAT